MKKLYTKPEIMFDDFTLSTNIAAGCEEKRVTHAKDEYGCGYKLNDRFNEVVFTSINGCNTPYDDGEYNQLCYHTPEESFNLFTS